MTHWTNQPGWQQAATSADCNALISNHGDNYWISGHGDAMHIRDTAARHGVHLDSCTVLDYGAGNGMVAVHMEELCSVLCAYDHTPEMLSQITKPGIITLSEIPDDLAFDVVYSIAVMLHNTSSEKLAILREVSACLRPGGLFLTECPLYDIPQEPQFFNDVGTLAPEWLHAYAEAAGFEVLELHSCPGKFDHRNLHPNHSALQVLRKR